MSCESNRCLTLCWPLLVGPLSDSMSFAEVFSKYVAPHVGATATVELVESCWIFHHLNGSTTQQLIADIHATPVSVAASFHCDSVKFRLHTPSSQVLSSTSAFDMLMASSRRALARTKLPEKYSRLPGQTLRADERLFNDVTDLVESHGLRWTSSSVQSAHRFCWYCPKRCSTLISTGVALQSAEHACRWFCRSLLDTMIPLH